MRLNLLVSVKPLWKRGNLLLKPKLATSRLELGTTPLGWLDPVSGLLLTDAKLLAGMFCFLSSPLSFCSCKEASCTDTVMYKNKGYGSIIKLVVQILNPNMHETKLTIK